MHVHFNSIMGKKKSRKEGILFSLDTCESTCCHPALAEPKGNRIRSSQCNKATTCSLCVHRCLERLKIRLYLGTWKEKKWQKHMII